MFEIRVICEPKDAVRIGNALKGAFRTGLVRSYPSRTPGQQRLYVRADHLPAPAAWPTPEEAYAKAPSIASEIGWVAKTAADKPLSGTLGRDFWLRKAAVLDRIALDDAEAGIHGDATEVAAKAAERLLAMDRDDEIWGGGYISEGPNLPVHAAAEANPRAYVRQEYAQWAKYH
ncbi:hypothetical protein [Streptomyces sp. NPDC002851]